MRPLTEAPGSEYGKSVFDTETEIVCDVYISQHSNREFEIKGIKYLIDEKELDDLPSQSTDTHSRDPNPSSFKCNLDITKVKQLQQQDTHITEIATKCKRKMWDKDTLFVGWTWYCIQKKNKDAGQIFSICNHGTTNHATLHFIWEP